MSTSTRLRAMAAVAAVAMASTLAGCASSSAGDDGRIAVVATTTQLGDFARSVGGTRIRLTRLLQPNTDPHEYEPTPSDVRAVAEANVVLQNGLGLDDWLDEVLSNAGGDATRVITTRDVQTSDSDPHVWLDPANAIRMVAATERALTAADPAGADTYRANARTTTEQISALDRELAALIANVPAGRRAIVTDHEAFGYFARRYGIDIAGTTVTSLSTAAEPSARQLTDLVQTIRRRGVRVVFAEASGDPRVARAVAQEAGVRLGPPLYADALGPAGGPAGTYLGMMRANMDAIITGIGA